MSKSTSQLPYWVGLRMSVFESDYTHQFYFDNYDITAMVEGVADMYISETPSDWKFKTFQFDNERTLVQNLVFGGMLNAKTSVGMLPAHQAEFYGRIKNDVVHSNFYDNHKERIRQAFYDGLQLEITSFNRGNKLNTTDWAKQINKWLDKNPTEVGKLYKLLYMTFQLHWSERMYSLFREKKYCRILSYDDPFEGLADNKVFEKLKSAWDRQRTDKDRNNFRDAMALFYLARHIDAFNTGKTKILPVFFDSSGSFGKAVKDAGLKEYFDLNVERNGKKMTFPALRDNYYFQTYALVHSKDVRGSSAGDEYDEIVEQYQKTRENFVKMYEELSDSYSDDNNTFERYARINQEINQYVNYDFLRYVVLPHFSEEQFGGVLRVLSLNREDLQKYQGRIAHRFQEDVEKIRQNMREDFISFEESRVIFQELKEKCFQLSRLKHGIPQGKRPLDIFLDFSLFRFFIPNESKEVIIEVFSSQELLADETPTRNMALLKLLDLFLRASKTGKNGSIKRPLTEVEIYVLVAAFWIFSCYKHFKKFSFDFSILSHSLLMLIGVSLLRDDTVTSQASNFKKVESILRILERRSEAADSEHLKAEIAIAIAYLNFQLWNREGGRLFVENNEIPKEEEGTRHLVAIKNAHFAFNYFSRSPVRYSDYELYSTNLYIYYVTDCGDEERFSKLRPVVNHFLKLRGGLIENWHFRYDDTLARYYHRDSSRAKTIETKRRQANNAQNLMEELLNELDGRKAIRDVRDIFDYKLILDGYITDLEL
jgi:hypothetical protein